MAKTVGQAAILAVIVAGWSSSALAQGRTATPRGTATPRTDTAIAVDEPAGNLVARARAAFEQLEFEQTVRLLQPLHTRAGVPPLLAVQAALLETNALVAQQLTPAAIEACQRAVRFANFDPDVARDQSPRVQAVCHTAADQARREFVSSRHIRIATVNVITGPVAWNSVALQIRIEGDLTGLTALAEVSVAGAPPAAVNLPGTGQTLRVAALDANLAVPRARIEVTPIVRDAFGVLARAESATIATVSANESAVRFGIGSDEANVYPLSFFSRKIRTCPMEQGRRDGTSNDDLHQR